MLNDQFAVERKVATECLERIFTTIRYLARQGLPLRGLPMYSDSDQTSDSFYIYVQVTRKIYKCGYKGRQRGLQKIYRRDN